MSIKIRNPDIAYVIKQLRVCVSGALLSFDNFSNSKDGDFAHLAEALHDLKHASDVLGKLELPSDNPINEAQLRLQMSNVVWDMGQFE
jgi:hypothetical protein